MFNGNTEDFRAWIDPEHPIQWSVRAYAARREDMLTRFADPAYAGIEKIHLRTQPEVDTFLASLHP